MQVKLRREWHHISLNVCVLLYIFSPLLYGNHTCATDLSVGLSINFLVKYFLIHSEISAIFERKTMPLRHRPRHVGHIRH